MFFPRSPDPESPRRTTPAAFKNILLGHAVSSTSQVRRRVDLVADDEQRQACQLLDALGDEALTLSVNTEALREALDRSPGEWVKRVRSIVRPSLTVLDAVADAFLDVLRVFSSPEAASLLANDGPLADYLRGILAWWRGTLAAFEGFAQGPRQREAHWLLRDRVDHARSFLFPELAARSREALVGLVQREELTATLDALVARATLPGRGLRAPTD